MIKVTNEAVERTSQVLIDVHYNLKQLFTAVKNENPAIAEYIKAQADKSTQPKEVYGTGIVVYLMIKHQWEVDYSKTTNQTDADPKDKDLEKFQNFLDKANPSDLGKILGDF